MELELKLTREKNITYYGKDSIIIDMEEYLRGVVPSEIGNAPIEACKAQAIVSRTFALNKKNLSDDSSSSQAFRVERMNSYFTNAYNAILQTKGQVLHYNGKLAQAYCCSSNGGIVNGKGSWNTQSIPYLKGGYKDEFDKGTGKTHTVGLSQLSAIERAKAGWTCEQILDFYFPGTTIFSPKYINIPCSSKEQAKLISSLLQKSTIIIG